MNNYTLNNVQVNKRNDIVISIDKKKVALPPLSYIGIALIKDTWLVSYILFTFSKLVCVKKTSVSTEQYCIFSFSLTLKSRGQIQPQ